MKISTRELFWNVYAFFYDVLVKMLPYQDLMNESKKVMAALNRKNLRILDAGGGTGNLMVKILHAFDEIFCYYCDFSPIMARKARKKLRKYESRISFSQVDLNKKTPYQDCFFGGITSINSLYALENPENTIREFYRICELGAILVIANPKKNAKIFNIFREHFSMILKLGLKEKITLFLRSIAISPCILVVIVLNLMIKKLAAKRTYHFYEPLELKEILERNNFKVIYWKFIYGNTDVYMVATKTTTIENNIEKKFVVSMAYPEIGTDFEEWQKLRYEIYCKEILSLDFKNYPLMQESDQYDIHSVQLLLWKENKLVGGLRLVPNSPYGFIFEEKISFPENLIREETLEISRIIIDESERGFGLWIALTEEAIKWSRGRGFTSWVMVGRKLVWDGLAKRGWKIFLWEEYREYHNTISAPGILEPPLFNKNK